MKRARICILLALTLMVVLGFGSTALASGGGPPCSISIINMHSDLDVTTSYDWQISKEAAPTEFTLSNKGSFADVAYTLSVTKVPGESVVQGSMSCQIKFDIDRNKMARVSITAYVTEDGNKLGNTQESYTNDYDYGSDKTVDFIPSFTPKAGSNYAVAYEGTIEWDYVGTPGHGGHWTESKNVSDSKPFSVTSAVNIVTPISVTDVLGALPAKVVADATTHVWTDITDNFSQTYTVRFTNNGADAGIYPVTNIATINELEGKDASATVAITVGRDDRNPEPREERKVRYPDPTPPPEELATAADSAVELPHTGGFIEWEWIALAGGMIASGGGALYLVRRRKMKK